MQCVSLDDRDIIALKIYSVGRNRTQIYNICLDFRNITVFQSSKLSIKAPACLFRQTSCRCRQAAYIDLRRFPKQDPVGVEQKNMRTVAIQITKDLAALIACNIIQNSLELLKIYCFSLADVEAVPVDSHVPAITGNIQLAAAGRADSAAAAYDLAALRQRIAPIGQKQHPAAQDCDHDLFIQKHFPVFHFLPPSFSYLFYNILYAKNHSRPFLSLSSLVKASPFSLRA